MLRKIYCAVCGHEWEKESRDTLEYTCEVCGDESTAKEIADMDKPPLK